MTKNQLRNEMIDSALLYHMVDGKFGLLPHDGVRGPRTADGGYYKRIHVYVKNEFGCEIGQGRITKLTKTAVKCGAAVHTKEVALPVYDTPIPKNATDEDLVLVNKYRHVHDSELVAIAHGMISEIYVRRGTTKGIIKFYQENQKLVGFHRFTIIMGIEKK